MCFSYLGSNLFFGVFGVFSLVCFELSLSVPVQVIAWKDSCPHNNNNNNNNNTFVERHSAVASEALVEQVS